MAQPGDAGQIAQMQAAQMQQQQLQQQQMMQMQQQQQQQQQQMQQQQMMQQRMQQQQQLQQQQLYQQQQWRQQQPTMVPAQVVVPPHSVRPPNTAGAWPQQPVTVPQRVVAPIAGCGGCGGASVVPPIVGPGAVASGAGGDSYVVYTTGNDTEEVVVRTLIGEYKEMGANHGRKFFQKSRENAGPDFVDVYLYYWDGRDGPNFEGWWFGNQLGGTQVWSHCAQNLMTVPSTGWKIPWDGAVRATLHVQNKAEKKRLEAEEKLQALTTEATMANNNGKEAVTQAKTFMSDPENFEGLCGAVALLQACVEPLAEVQKNITEAQKTATPQTMPRLQMLGNQIRLTSTAVTNDLAAATSAKETLEITLKNKELEDKDMVGYNELLPEAERRTHAAEDAVEKTAITWEMISAAGDDMGEARRAVEETEQASSAAQKLIQECRMFLNSKQAAARSFKSQKVKDMAAAEIGKLQEQLQAAQARLNPLKTARQDFQMRQQAQKVAAEALSKLTPAELAIDKAEEAAEQLKDDLSEESLKAAEQMHERAAEAMAFAQRSVDSKLQAAPPGPVQDELNKLTARIQAGMERLTQLKQKQAEAFERVNCLGLIKEAEAKLAAVTDAASKAADAEGPFLMGVEELPLEDTMVAVKACEGALTAANTAASIAKMFIATKLVEAKRFSEGPSTEAVAKLKQFQITLENCSKKLATLKTNTASRKRKALAREAERLVEEAERLTSLVIEAADIFTDDSKIFESSADEVTAACEATTKAAATADAALSDARRFITERQIEAKGKDAAIETSNELVKLQTRLSVAQADVGKHRRLSASTDSRLAARRVVEEAKAKVQTVEDEVKQVSLTVNELGEETVEASKGEDVSASGDVEEKVKAIEQAIADAQRNVRNVSRELENMGWQQNGAKDEIHQLQPRLTAAQTSLDQLALALKERSDKDIARALVQEASTKLSEAEAAVDNLAMWEAPFLKGNEFLPIEEANSALSDADVRARAAHSAVGSTKTFFATKRVAAKRLAPAIATFAADELEKLQTKLDTIVKALDTAKRGIFERKQGVINREIEAAFDKVEKNTEAVRDTAKNLMVGDGSQETDEMRKAYEKLTSSQQEALAEVTELRSLIAKREREAHVPQMSAEALEIFKTKLSKLTDQLNEMQTGLEQDKEAIMSQQSKLVSEKLINDTTATVESLEKKAEAARKLVTAFVSDDPEENFAAVNLVSFFDIVKANMQRTGKTADAAFDEMSGKKEKASESDFLAYARSLPELSDLASGMANSDAELKAVFLRLTGSRSAGEQSEGSAEMEAPQLSKALFVDQFKNRYIVTAVVTMTSTLVVKGGKMVRRLVVNEVLEALEEPVNDVTTDLLRVKARTEKDGKEGYVALKSSYGTTYLQPYSATAASQRRAEKVLDDLNNEVSKVLRSFDRKLNDLRNIRTGPLEESRNVLSQMRPRTQQIQTDVSNLRWKVSEAEKTFAEALKEQNRRRQEAQETKIVTAIMNECEAEVSNVQALVDKIVPAAEALVKSRGADKENPLLALKEAEKELVDTVEALKKAQDVIAVHMAKECMNGSAKGGPFAEGRNALVKLKVKVGNMDSRCKKQINALRGAHKLVAVDAHASLAKTICCYAREKELTSEAFFKELSKGSADIPSAALKDFVKGLPGNNQHDCVLDLALERYGGFISKLSFASLAQEYFRCNREIAVTNRQNVKEESKTLRKLGIGDIVEIVGEMVNDDTTNLTRAKCIVMEDLSVGFVTVKGNQGTGFLDKCSKPYFCCVNESDALQADFASSSDSLSRRLHQDEVLELVEGPRKEQGLEVSRLHGKALKDGKQGWVTIKDLQNNVNFELAKLLICRQAIALTTVSDISDSDSKTCRKLEVGEVLEPLEKEVEDTQKSITRVRVKCTADGVEGWVTIKGNQGTAFLEELENNYLCKRATPMQKAFASTSDELREIAVGETLELIEGPKVETKDGIQRMKVRSLLDGVEGWLPAASSSIRPWAPKYRSLRGDTILMDADGKEIRSLAQGELLDALDTPVLLEATGKLQVKVRAETDAVVGVVSTRGDGGVALLEPVVQQ